MELLTECCRNCFGSDTGFETLPGLSSGRVFLRQASFRGECPSCRDDSSPQHEPDHAASAIAS